MKGVIFNLENDHTSPPPPPPFTGEWPDRGKAKRVVGGRRVERKEWDIHSWVIPKGRHGLLLGAEFWVHNSGQNQQPFCASGLPVYKTIALT